jgi:diguanylate cyclase (GGDEF)-like protein
MLRIPATIHPKYWFKLNINNPNLWLYSILSKLPQPKSYIGKIMFVAFLGTHVPLLTLLIYFLLSNSFSFETTVRVLVIALLATLIGTGITLYALTQLLAPVILTYLAQRAYINHKKLPNLPTQYTDEAGTLMKNTVQTLEKLDQVIDYLTNYDDLTGLPNRVLFKDYLQQALLRSQTQNHLVAVICLDVNNFKEINNALGIAVSDQFIKTVAEQLSSSVPSPNMLCRLGSDKFAIALADLTTSEEVVPFCQQLLTQLAQPITLNGNQLPILATLGIAIYPLDSQNVEQLLQNSNTAIDEAKQRPQSNYQFYSSEMNAQLQERLGLENQLRHALARNEFQLYYQPRVDVQSRKIVGVEALIRWQNPHLGFVSPVKFIPIAEANGLIIPIGEWVLRTACQQNRLWQEAGLPPLKVAVNLSARQLAQTNLIEMVTAILEETHLKAVDLELEVTESLLMENVQQSIQVLQQLHEMGISLALDDFGTGYSSLNYLRHFPIDTLKIDRSFIRDVVDNPHDSAVTNAIIALAKSLHLNITAEGVETQAQFNYIQERGCNEVQGYYFSPPITAVALTELLKKDESLSQYAIA